MQTNWFAMSARFYKDPKIQAIGEKHGSSGPTVISASLCEARLQGGSGQVELTFRLLAAETFVDFAVIRPVLETAAELGVVEIESISELAAVVSFPKWGKWQAAFRASSSRAKKNGESNGVSHEVTPSHTNKTGQDRKKTSSSAKPPSEARQVFDAWVEATGKTRAEFSEDRRNLINNRLRRWPVEDLIDAVRGWRHSPHHRGENEQAKAYNNLSLLIRNTEKIEEFRDLERAAKSRSKAPAKVALP